MMSINNDVYLQRSLGFAFFHSVTVVFFVCVCVFFVFVFVFCFFEVGKGVGGMVWYFLLFFFFFSCLVCFYVLFTLFL